MEKKNAEKIRKERIENRAKNNVAKRMATSKNPNREKRMRELRKEMMDTLENSDIHTRKH